MATFYNQATLSYNGISTTSNITTGEIISALTLDKNVLSSNYSPGSNITYSISILNSGTNAFTDLTLSDNLGAYTYNSQTLTPMTFKTGSIQYYVNGVLQPTPTVSGSTPLTVSGINVPAGGNALIIYETTANQYAPQSTDSTIENTATLSGTGITTPLTAQAVVTTSDAPILNISKALSPVTVSENGQITYTFQIENTGNVATTVDDNVVISDTFNPILNSLTATFNGTPWTSPTNYTYDTTTGVFSSVAGQITVPAATYTQDTTTGAWSVTPGVSTLTITGTI